MKKYIHFAQPLFGTEEKKEVIKAMDSGWVTLGPGTKAFEEEFAKYTGAKYAVGLSSCTAALHLALIAAGVGPGDEVITTIFTFAASINPVLILGGKPVLVDIDERGKIEVIYAKGRYSSVANNYLYFDKPRQRLTSWNDWFGSPMYEQEAELGGVSTENRLA